MEMELEMENRDEIRKQKMEDANERWNNGNGKKQDEMENLQAMLRLLSKSLYGMVSEIMQGLTKNTLYW